MSASELEMSCIVETREYFSDIGVWPERPRQIDASGWLKNFRNEMDQRLAATLLDSFLVISTKQCSAMVKSAFHALSSMCGDMFDLDTDNYARAWDEFRDSVIVTFPKRRSDPTGSGHIFARAARELVPKPTLQILDPATAIRSILAAPASKPVVFVDDFSGSGDQFLETWFGQTASQMSKTSFSDLADEGRIASAYFTPAIATWRARQNVLSAAPFVRVLPAHVLPPRYSAAEPTCTLVPAADHDALDDLLLRYAKAAGYAPSARYGYQSCGLALSFEHATPDNTLPIFNGGPERPKSWRPLRRNH